MPIPPIYVMEIEDGVYELIDGLQRISSYFHFRGKHPTKTDDPFLELGGCDIVPALNGKSWDDLPQAVQIKLKRHFIRMEVLRKETDPTFKYHVFKRLNTGGEILSEQEIRNCTIRLLDNTLNDFLRNIIKDEHFQATMGQLTEEKREQMYLEEYALRFFAFCYDRDSYVKNVGDFLTGFMEAVAKKEREFDYEQAAKTFADTFRVLNASIGESAFSVFTTQGNPKNQFSALHFEALTLGIQPHLPILADWDEEQLKALDEKLRLIKVDSDFRSLTTGGGRNYSAALNHRIEFVSQKVGECLST